jgi:phosphoribosyl 1,2-cyclic phosphodiesterase
VKSVGDVAGVELVFLGTGGGRFAAITQKRRTGGIRILSKTLNAHLDPGPGALIYSLNAGLDPQKINAVLVSHAHPDHYANAEILIEAMTRGMTSKRGTLAAARSVLSGNSTCGPAISKYHQQKPEKIIEATPGTNFDLGGMKFLTVEARHSDSDAVGFRFETKGFGSIAYTSDTEYFKELGKLYEGVRLLILCAMRPFGVPWKGHMTTEDAIKIVEEAKPETAVITHFGIRMIFKGPDSEAKLIQRKTGVPIIAAKDGMRLNMARELNIREVSNGSRYLY